MRNLSEEFKPKCNFTFETLLAIISVFVMWICYYLFNSTALGDNILFITFWGFGIMIGMNVIFPAWWIVIKKKEGFEGMGITKKNLGLAILFSVALGLIRMPELVKACADVPASNLVSVVVFNLLSIWEACFLFSWLYTRYNRAFGKGIAAVLTSISIGIYHCGTLKTEQILTLMAYIMLCSLCFAITDNVFTLWPIYWIVGCTASVIRAYGANSFPWSLAMSMGMILVVQLILLLFIWRRSKKYAKIG